jgi:DNA-binding CsgD family transcriptional regulator
VGHFARACRLESELRNVRDRRLALAEAIDRFPTGVILVDSKQQRVLSNRCAERVLALSDGLTMVDERPTADRSNEARALREAISAAIAESASREEAPPRIVALSRPSGEPPLQLMVAALRDAPDAAADGQPVAVLFVPDPQSAQVETTVLEQLYSLTPSEASFIAAFVAERSLDDAATARGIRKSTARGYLKNVFQKTGTNSQHGLMRLLLTGIGRIEKP